MRKTLPVGCIGVIKLPAEGFLDIRCLAVKDVFSKLNIVDELIEAALKYSFSQKPKLLRAVTLAIQPYVEAYKRFGFRPVRRILRITWDLSKACEEHFVEKASIVEVDEENVEESVSVCRWNVALLGLVD